MRLTPRRLAAVLALAVAGGTAWGAEYPGERAAAEGALGEFVKESGAVFIETPGNWFSDSRITKFTSPLRASSEPGVCERDVLTVSLAPAGEGPAAAARTRKVEVERQYRFLGTEPAEDFDAEKLLARERQCRELDRSGEPDAWMLYKNADDAGAFWFAGQFVTALAEDLQRPALERRVAVTCAGRGCEGLPRLLTAAAVGSARSVEPCGGQALCLSVLLTPPPAEYEAPSLTAVFRAERQGDVWALRTVHVSTDAMIGEL